MNAAAKNQSGTPRQNFNWGFHDAQDDRARGRAKRDVGNHFNAIYGIGYLYGWAHPESHTSEPAWLRCDTLRTRHVTVEQPVPGGPCGYRIQMPGLAEWHGGYAGHIDAANAATTALLGLIAGGFIEV